MKRYWHWHFVLAAFFCVAPLAAQNPGAVLTGIVQDSSGARIPNARVTLSLRATGESQTLQADAQGEFHSPAVPPGEYRVTVEASGFRTESVNVGLPVSSAPRIVVTLHPAAAKTERAEVKATEDSLSAQPLEPTSSVEKATITNTDLEAIPLAARSFANIAYMAPMTSPVEPSDPSKARITAVSFGGSSGLNVDLSVDGGDNNDDYIGGFLQNYSPEAIQEFAVRTAQFDADTSRTNGGSIIITTRRGTNRWHGDLSAYLRNQALNARNDLDNPEPQPKQPFSRYNGAASAGGPLVKDKLWLFSSFEYISEDASINYSPTSLTEFNALSQLASSGQIDAAVAQAVASGLTGGFVPASVTAIPVPNFTSVPFHDWLFSARADWAQSSRSHWFLRGALDRYHTDNDLVQQATLPSTGAATESHYYSILLSQDY